MSYSGMFWVVLAGRAKRGDSKALNTFACISSFNREESHFPSFWLEPSVRILQ